MTLRILRAVALGLLIGASPVRAAVFGGAIGGSSGGPASVVTSAPISGTGTAGSPITCTGCVISVADSGAGTITVAGTATAPTLLCTSATGTQAGCITAGTQTLGGAKTWTGIQLIQNALQLANTNGVTHHQFKAPSASSTELDLTDGPGTVLARWDTSGNSELIGIMYFGSGNPLANGGPRIRASSGAIVTEGAVAATAINAFVDTNGVTITTGAIQAWKNAGTEVLRVTGSGKFVYPASGAADVRGTATLSSGTVTVSTTAVKTGDVIFCSYNTPGGTAGVHCDAPVASIVDGTSFVINSVAAAGTVVGTDTSTVNWWIIH